MEVPANFLGPCLPVSTMGHAHSAVLTGRLTGSPKAAHLKLESECESKALTRDATFSHRTMTSKEVAEPAFGFLQDPDGRRGVQTHGAPSQGYHGNSFHVPMFHSELSKRVSRTHYFVTQRVCLRLLVFISINFVSAGLTRITTSMSCTFDLKIKLIWEVFKALLIFIRPLTVARRLASFVFKIRNSPSKTVSWLQLSQL